MSAHEMRRRQFLKLAGGAAGAGILTRHALNPRRSDAATGRSVVFCSFGGAYQEAQRKGYLEPFQRDTGIKVIEASPVDYGKIKAMVKSGNVEWDVVVAEGFFVFSGGKEGLLEPLDYNVINAKDFYPGTVHKYGLGELAYSSVIGYNTKRFPGGQHPKNWAEFWDVKRFPGNRSLYKLAYSTLETALMADGMPPDPKRIYPMTPALIDRAFRSLDKIKPYIHAWWSSGAQSAQLLSDGEVDLIEAWNGRIYDVEKKGATADIEWNQGLLQIPSLCVVRGTPHRDLAMKLIAYIARPEISAGPTKYIPYGPSNRKAYNYIDKAAAKNFPTSPENFEKQLVVNDEWWGDHITSLEERFKTWLLK